MDATPTYLPWLAPGEEVPEARRVVERGASYVAWATGEGDPSDQSYVIFRRDGEPRGGRGERVPLRLEGSEGYFYGAPGSDASVLWKTGRGRCSLITLAVSLPGADRDELRDEVLKIVKSLEV